MEIKADEALLWLRAYHRETIALAQEGFALWRDLSECNQTIASEGGWDKASVVVQSRHRQISGRIAEIRKSLEERAQLSSNE